jgi:glycosyltransferase involved in cell wall biosynthesis
VISTSLYDVAPVGTARATRADRAATIRVLHVVNGEHYAGAERVQDSLALRLPEQGFEVGFACLKPNRFAAMRQAQESALYDVGMRGRLDFRPVARLATLIRRQQYAIVHTHGPRTAMVGSLAAMLARVPFVHHVHTQTRVEVGRRWMNRFSALVERGSLARVAGLISVSPSVSRYLREHGCARHRVWLVPNGVPAGGDLPPRRPPASAWTVGIVALLRPRKGLEVMLRAMARLRALGIPVRLRAVGSFETTDYERETKRYASELGLAGMVDWVGFRRNVSAELRRMDIFVLPSVLSEGMPMSVLEAMSVGTPVVATRVEGVTDVIHDGEDGLLAAPGDAHDLARVLAAVIRGEVDGDRVRTTAHRRQAEKYSDRSMAAGVATVYREILDDRG